MKPSTLRIGRRYRPHRLKPDYDALIIGSGMGGLTTAAFLSELGWKVCVLEQHYTAGGYTHSFERHGYEWDPGVHYIGDVGRESGTRRMFDFLSGGQLEWAAMDEEYDRFYIGDKVFCARAGKRCCGRAPTFATARAICCAPATRHRSPAARSAPRAPWGRSFPPRSPSCCSATSSRAPTSRPSSA